MDSKKNKSNEKAKIRMSKYRLRKKLLPNQYNTSKDKENNKTRQQRFRVIFINNFFKTLKS